MFSQIDPLYAKKYFRHIVAVNRNGTQKDKTTTAVDLKRTIMQRLSQHESDISQTLSLIKEYARMKRPTTRTLKSEQKLQQHDLKVDLARLEKMYHLLAKTHKDSQKLQQIEERMNVLREKLKA